MSDHFAKLSIFALGVMMSGPAEASTPEAWNELYRRAGRSCTAASSLSSATISTPVRFDDRRGILALLVTGISRGITPEPRVSELCLYDRRTGRVAITCS